MPIREANKPWSNTHEIVPSMYLRRLWLLGLLMLAGAGVMVAKAYRIAVVQGEQHLAEAEARLVVEDWTPTVRGRIVDRKGRVLAEDKPGFDLQVQYRFITGEWEYRCALRRAREEVGAGWFKLSPEQREREVGRYLPEFQARAAAIWSELTAILAWSDEEMEAKLSSIVGTVQTQATVVKGAMLKKRREQLAERGKDPASIELFNIDQELAVQREPHVIDSGLDDVRAFEIRRLAERAAQELPLGSRASPRSPIEVVKSGVRVYPLETMQVAIDRSTFPRPLRPPEDADPSVEVEVVGVATHILGWMKVRQAEDLQDPRFVRPRVDRATGAIDYGHYRTGDLIGATGVERAREETLRGDRGRVVKHLDSGEEQTIEARAGLDVPLTIDAVVQAKVQALMEPVVGLARLQEWHISAIESQRPVLPMGSPIRGAAVVLEIETGELLALVTTPSFTREMRSTAGSGFWNDPVARPAINKAISGRYPPGSIIKPLVLAAAVTEGVHTLSNPISCTGHFYPNRNDLFRCWIYKQFNTTHDQYYPGGLQSEEALAVSCNIYFYTLANKLGFERLTKWYARFGIGTAINLGLGEEYPGYAGEGRSGADRGSRSADAINMGIGQGPVDYTPLHAADIFATLARGGVRLKPRLFRDERPRSEEVRLDPDAVEAALEGLRQAVSEEFGTGHHINFGGGFGRENIFLDKGVTIRGKTGTADAPGITVDGVVVLPAQGTDHSWFVVLVGPQGKNAPAKYVVAVLMEYAGSGGRVSGPICNQIIHVLKEEGYL